MNDVVSRSLQRSLRQVFGLERLRPLQREVIERMFDGEDVLAIMPTGAGKSLCYQLPGSALPGIYPNARMPNTQRLMSSGVVFSHAYTAGMTCGPSRASLDTGLYTQTHGVGGGFPASSFSAANYWVDVVFTNTLNTDLTAPTVTAKSPASGAHCAPIAIPSARRSSPRCAT